MGYCGRNNHTSIDMVTLLPMVFGLVFILTLCIGGCVVSSHREFNQTFTVTGKENVKSGNSGKYLIYTDKTTYEITDTWLFWRWNSSDVYGNMQIGKTYEATLQGYRVPFLSWYQNVLDPVVVNPEKK